MERLELEIIDEEPENYSIFEPADVSDVLDQLAPELNDLTIFTDRPAYFEGFAETMYEENGLIVMLFPKKNLRECCGSTERRDSLKNGFISRGKTGQKLVLDFEWEGSCYLSQLKMKKGYIPIHKKPWKIGENLDIAVPFGYNTVIVKNVQMTNKKPVRDRFEEAFYRNE